jgi:hypothetical protein
MAFKKSFQSARDVLEGATLPSRGRRVNGCGDAKLPRPFCDSESSRGPPQTQTLLNNGHDFGLHVRFQVWFSLLLMGADPWVASGTLVYRAPVKKETEETQLDNVTDSLRTGLEQSAHAKLFGDITESFPT